MSEVGLREDGVKAHTTLAESSDDDNGALLRGVTEPKSPENASLATRRPRSKSIAQTPFQKTLEEYERKVRTRLESTSCTHRMFLIMVLRCFPDGGTVTLLGRESRRECDLIRTIAESRGTTSSPSTDFCSNIVVVVQENARKKFHQKSSELERLLLEMSQTSKAQEEESSSLRATLLKQDEDIVQVC